MTLSIWCSVAFATECVISEPEAHYIDEACVTENLSTECRGWEGGVCPNWEQVLDYGRRTDNLYDCDSDSTAAHMWSNSLPEGEGAVQYYFDEGGLMIGVLTYIPDADYFCCEGGSASIHVAGVRATCLNPTQVVFDTGEPDSGGTPPSCGGCSTGSTTGVYGALLAFFLLFWRSAAIVRPRFR